MDNEEKEIGFELQQLKKDVLWYTNQFHFLNRLQMNHIYKNLKNKFNDLLNIKY